METVAVPSVLYVGPGPGLESTGFVSERDGDSVVCAEDKEAG